MTMRSTTEISMESPLALRRASSLPVAGIGQEISMTMMTRASSLPATGVGVEFSTVLMRPSTLASENTPDNSVKQKLGQGLPHPLEQELQQQRGIADAVQEVVGSANASTYHRLSLSSVEHPLKQQLEIADVVQQVMEWSNPSTHNRPSPSEQHKLGQGLQHPLQQKLQEQQQGIADALQKVTELSNASTCDQPLSPSVEQRLEYGLQHSLKQRLQQQQRIEKVVQEAMESSNASTRNLPPSPLVEQTLGQGLQHPLQQKLQQQQEITDDMQPAMESSIASTEDRSLPSMEQKLRHGLLYPLKQKLQQQQEFATAVQEAMEPSNASTYDLRPLPSVEQKLGQGLQHPLEQKIQQQQEIVGSSNASTHHGPSPKHKRQINVASGGPDGDGDGDGFVVYLRNNNASNNSTKKPEDLCRKLNRLGFLASPQIDTGSILLSGASSSRGSTGCPGSELQEGVTSYPHPMREQRSTRLNEGKEITGFNLNPLAKDFVSFSHTDRGLQEGVATVPFPMTEQGSKKWIEGEKILQPQLNPLADEFVPTIQLNQLAQKVIPPSDVVSNAVSGALLSMSRPRRQRGGNDQRTMAHVQTGGSLRRTVYVSQIDQQVTEGQLAALFFTCGPVVDCRICGDPKSALRFNLGFVEFSSKKSAKAALSLDGTMLGSHSIIVQRSKTPILPVNPILLPQSEEEVERCNRTIYCTNIDKTRDVKEFFEGRCGKVAQLRFLESYRSNTHTAVVEFVMGESAMIALTCSGHILGSCPIRVSPSKTPVRPGLELQQCYFGFTV